MPTKIEWAEESWNPITGCTKVSEGCKNCYAERIAKRFWGDRKFTNVQFHPERLEQPLHWKKPRRIFVCSMSDLFHEFIEAGQINMVMNVIQECPQHTFIVLTKRPRRMRKLMLDYWSKSVLPNLWLGVSVENQKRADERIPTLLDTPAAVRFVSCEPLLGEIDLTKLHDAERLIYYDVLKGSRFDYGLDGYGVGAPMSHRLYWVIVGGESGPGTRPMDPEWVRSIRDQCQAARVPFFFKQWGEWAHVYKSAGAYWLAEGMGGSFIKDSTRIAELDNGTLMARVGKKRAGRLLSDRVWNGYPGVRESSHWTYDTKVWRQAASGDPDCSECK